MPPEEEEAPSDGQRSPSPQESLDELLLERQEQQRIADAIRISNEKAEQQKLKQKEKEEEQLKKKAGKEKEKLVKLELKEAKKVCPVESKLKPCYVSLLSWLGKNASLEKEDRNSGVENKEFLLQKLKGETDATQAVADNINECITKNEVGEVDAVVKRAKDAIELTKKVQQKIRADMKNL